MQIEKWVHLVIKQYLKINSLSFAKTLQTYVEMVFVNTDISNIRFHCMEPELYGIKVGCNFFGTPCIYCEIIYFRG